MHDLSKPFISSLPSEAIMSHGNQFETSNGLQVEPMAEVVTEASLLEPCRFPISSAPEVAVEEPRMKYVEVCVNPELVSEAMKQRVPTFQWVQTAWAILLRCYIGNDSVSFGVLPVRHDGILVNRQLSLSGFVETSEVLACQLQLSAEDSILATMQWVSLSKYARRDFEANNINTALTLPLSFPSRHGHRDINHSLQHLQRKSAPDFDIIVNATEDESALEVTLNYRYPRISTETASGVATTLEKILAEMISGTHGTIGELDCLSYRDRQQIQNWNSIQKPKYHFDCVHRVFEYHSRLAPSANAICSWDGNMNYSELNKHASSVALQLVELGVSPGVYIPFCFEKSMWAVVATLAILKAGAAFVPLDPDHPISRVTDIVQSVDAKIVIASPIHAHLFMHVVDHIVILSSPTVRALLNTSDCTFSSSVVSPQDPAFLLFTSGSTGRPKGIIQEHSSVVSNAFAHGKAMHYRKDSRVLQFAAHTFDVAQMDIFTTLLQGGCICIPSEEDRRNDILGVITRMRVNWALLTPSFASLLHPHQVPSLRTLALGGEALTKECTQRWAGKLLLINCYGPAECGACLTLEVDPSSYRTANNVGYALPNSICWLAHPDNHHKLVPVGAVGELLVEGPNLARCYLNDEKKTRESFIEDPHWAGAGKSPRRFYKTGDLLKYNDDGSMDFIGREDTQIKLRGQRVELGEVEYHISTMQDVAVSMVGAPKEGCYVNELVAVIQLRGRQPHSVRNGSPIVRSKTSFDLKYIKSHVERTLPTYMVPTVCIVVQSMPFTSSLKVDRNMVVGWLENMTTRIANEDARTVHSQSHDVLTMHESVAMRISSKIVEIVASKESQRRSYLESRDLALNSIGLDSIQIISLSMFLRSAFNSKLPLRVLLDSKTTIRSLAEYIEGTVNGSNENHVPVTINIVDETSRLGLQFVNYMTSNAPQHALSTRPRPQNILLTGATGFLGLEILKDIMTQSHFQAFLLVRARSVSEGLNRIVNAATAAKWWTAQYSSRLSIWIGDLSEPRLGLSKIHWQQLTGHCHPEHSVHAIIHNGARVNWNSDYLTLKGPNVDSTMELLTAASISVALSSFVFVSGGELPTSNGAEDSSMAAISGAFRPNTNGYSQSKLVSERLVERYARLRSQPEVYAHHQQHISIVKPGYIIGTVDDGVANQNDFIWRLVAACIDISAYSQVHGEPFLFVASVQRVAHAAVASMMLDRPSRSPRRGETKEVDVPYLDGADRPLTPAENSIEPTLSITRILDGVPLNTLWTILSHSFGYDLQPLPARDWLSRLQSVVAANGPSHVFFPFLHTLEQESDNTAITAEGPTSDGMPDRASNPGIGGEGGTNVADYGDVEAVIRRNIQYLIDVGFLPAAKGQGTRGAGTGYANGGSRAET